MMERVTQMDKEIFRSHLMQAMEKIRMRDQLEYEEVQLLVEPMHEPDKSLNGADEMMRLVVLAPNNVQHRQFTVDEAVNLLCWHVPLVPLWIDVSLVEVEQKRAVFRLICSLRLRKPTQLRYAETGHAPFRVV
ncbi:hypothetical protein AB4Z30_08350 [Paenibacillus sp. 2TAF8]|jgi:hypothetical protein|uniref:hypothetical protein n=1 Tax=Paenibacillus sp. 2TAF8 TaxID=3233020 RepID=UPI003F95E7DC